MARILFGCTLVLVLLLVPLGASGTEASAPTGTLGVDVIVVVQDGGAVRVQLSFVATGDHDFIAQAVEGGFTEEALLEAAQESAESTGVGGATVSSTEIGGSLRLLVEWPLQTPGTATALLAEDPDNAFIESFAVEGSADEGFVVTGALASLDEAFAGVPDTVTVESSILVSAGDELVLVDVEGSDFWNEAGVTFRASEGATTPFRVVVGQRAGVALWMIIVGAGLLLLSVVVVGLLVARGRRRSQPQPGSWPVQQGSPSPWPQQPVAPPPQQPVAPGVDPSGWPPGGAG